MNTTRPLVSIVMPSMNQGEFIEQSIRSVLQQDYQNLELIVQDGGSTDDTLVKLEEISSLDSRLRWFSEPDTGPAEAINRALGKTRGEIIGWLNSDDLYTAHAISKAATTFTHHTDWLLVYGHGEYIGGTDEFIRTYPTRTPDAGLASFESGCFISQPTVFFKSIVRTLIGRLDTGLKTAFDYDYWMRAFKVFPDRIGFIDSVLARSRLHEDCITLSMKSTVTLEGLELGKRHFGVAKPHWAASFLEELRHEHGSGSAEFIQRASNFIDSAEEFLAPGDMEQLKLALRS